jgi:TPP-dependent pyruvate/acetoin dehydrogenase alpha subunit
MAAVWRAPVVFVVENNLYGEYSPLRETTPLDDLFVRAGSYAIPGVAVDGQDVEAAYAVACEAVAYARAGEGPTLIESKTYRYRGHSRSDPARYRPDGELERWKARDPIELVADRLQSSGTLTAEARTALWAQVQEEIDRLADIAADASAPTFEEARSYVYAG